MDIDQSWNRQPSRLREGFGGLWQTLGAGASVALPLAAASCGIAAALAAAAGAGAATLLREEGVGGCCCEMALSSVDSSRSEPRGSGRDADADACCQPPLSRVSRLLSRGSRWAKCLAAAGPVC